MAKNKKVKAPKKKKTFKERFKKGDIEIPNCIRTSIVKLYLLAVGIFVVGVILAVWSKDWVAGVLTLVVALGVAGFAFYKDLKLSRDGYLEAVGTVVKVEYTIGSQVMGTITNGKSKDIPTRFLVEMDGELYAIPFYKQWQILDEGDVVKIYLSNNVKFMSVRGAYTPDGILGYEMYLGDDD